MCKGHPTDRGKKQPQLSENPGAVGKPDVGDKRTTSVESLLFSVTVGRAAIGTLVTRKSYTGNFAVVFHRRHLLGFVGRSIPMVWRLSFWREPRGSLCHECVCSGLAKHLSRLLCP